MARKGRLLWPTINLLLWFLLCSVYRVLSINTTQRLQKELNGDAEEGRRCNTYSSSKERREKNSIIQHTTLTYNMQIYHTIQSIQQHTTYNTTYISCNIQDTTYSNIQHTTLSYNIQHTYHTTYNNIYKIQHTTLSYKTQLLIFSSVQYLPFRLLKEIERMIQNWKAKSTV